MKIWLRADLGVTKDGSDLVALWEDQSATGHDVSQSNDAKKPLYVASAVNGHPVLRFGGIDDFLQNTNELISGSTSRWMFVVAKPDASVDTDSFIGDGDIDASTDKHVDFATQPAIYVVNAWRIWTPALSTSAYQVLTVAISGTTTDTATLRIDGVAQSVGSTNDGPIDVSTSGRFTVGDTWGNLQGTPVFPYDGDIAEILIYSSSLSDTNRDRIEAYLSARYAL